MRLADRHCPASALLCGPGNRWAAKVLIKAGTLPINHPSPANGIHPSVPPEVECWHMANFNLLKYAPLPPYRQRNGLGCLSE